MVLGKLVMTSRWLRPDTLWLGTKVLLSICMGLIAAVAVSTQALGQAARAACEPICERRVDSGKIWRWPLQGQVVLGYNPALPGRKGIKIGGKPRQAVLAAAAGRVVYVGSGLPHDGRLIIVKHRDNLLSAYSHLGKILVKQGEVIQSGQIIARLGAGKTDPVLHFEIRRNGKPVNPLNFLPARRMAAEA